MVVALGIIGDGITGDGMQDGRLMDLAGIAADGIRDGLHGADTDMVRLDMVVMAVSIMAITTVIITDTIMVIGMVLIMPDMEDTAVDMYMVRVDL